MAFFDTYPPEGTVVHAGGAPLRYRWRNVTVCPTCRVVPDPKEVAKLLAAGKRRDEQRGQRVTPKGRA